MKGKSLERTLWAITLILVGILLLIGNTDLIDYNIGAFILNLWPLFLIIPGIASLQRGKIFMGSLLSIGGISFLLANYTTISIWQYVWPLLIISWGIYMLLGSPNLNKKGESAEDYIDEAVVFGGIEKKIKTDKFSGGRVDCVFGGSQIDLRKVQIAGKKATLEVTAIFGGGEIFVNPENYKVVSKGTGIFGGWVNKAEASDKKKPVLEITGVAIFGGVEIKS
jgi:predicted membrane protein